MDQYGQVKHDNKVLSQFKTAIEEGDVVVSTLYFQERKTCCTISRGMRVEVLYL